MNLFNHLKLKKNRNTSVISLPYEIPPLYKLFINIFEVGSNTYFAENFIDNENKVDGFNLFYLKYEEANLQILNFYNEKDLLEDFDSYLKDEEIFHDFKLVRIGNHLFGGGIYLGCDPLLNFDQIFIYFWNDQKLNRYSNNIFEFISMINSEIDEYQINEIIKNSSNLYKNWNEDFWRIKPSDFRDARPYELLDKDSLNKRYSELKKSGAQLTEIESEYRIRGLELPKKFYFW
ncbi:MAG: hypothetical protein WAT22_10030 [Saprospiraceae bacterium]